MRTWLLSLLAGSIITWVVAQPPPPVEYGVDVSYPMHHHSVSTNFDYLPHNVDPENNPTPKQYRNQPIQPLGDRNAFHHEYLEGCRQKYKKQGNRCDGGEYDRVEMCLRQPQSMRNYTKMGFTKIRAPDHVFELIKNFWELNQDRAKPERWPTGNIYTNHWAAPSKMVSVEDPTLEDGGYVLKSHIWNAARNTIEEWTGQRLVECSLYGIRVYPEGAVLAPHVDRLPLVSSAIINVDQDVDEPWPLEVIGHDGKAYNITMVPGDLVLYESHSVIHGRPFPLKGRFMANVFIHFEPIGPSNGQIEYTGDLPPYVIPGSPAEANWRRQNPNGHTLHTGDSFTTGSTEAHRLAHEGQLESLKHVLNENTQLVNSRDVNGWTPLHEAVRNGQTDVVYLLLERGADPNARTGTNNEGGSALHLVEEYHGDGDSLVKDDLEYILKKYDAKLHRPVYSQEL